MFLKLLKGITNRLQNLGIRDEDRLYWKFGRTFPANKTIFEEGDEGSQMYVIQSGQVSIRRRIDGLDREIAVLGPGDFFGEFSLLTNMKRSATARTIQEVRLLEIDNVTFDSLIRIEEEVTLNILKRFASRIISANQHNEKLIKRIWKDKVIFQLLLREGEQTESWPTVDQLAHEVDLPENAIKEIIKGLEELGFIQKKQRGGYAILDKGRLRGLFHKIDEY